MSIYIDADVFARWEKGQFDLPAWLEARVTSLQHFPPQSGSSWFSAPGGIEGD